MPGIKLDSQELSLDLAIRINNGVAQAILEGGRKSDRAAGIIRFSLIVVITAPSY